MIAFEENNNTENEITDTERILRVMADHCNLATENEICLERWKNVVTAMIEKKPGHPYIEKL